MKNAEEIWELMDAGMLSLEEFKEWVTSIKDVAYNEGRDDQFWTDRTND